MSRFLTPSKITLLALISLYCESAVPVSSTVPILSFIVSHVSIRNSSGDRLGTTDVDLLVGLDVFQSTTIIQPSNIPGRTIWDLLLKKLWEINSFDAVHAFFESLVDLLPKTKDELDEDAEDGVTDDPSRLRLSWVSPLGLFVRRAQLEFTRVQLLETIQLWKQFVTYRHPTFPTWKKRNPGADWSSVDVHLSDGFEGAVGKLLYDDLHSENETTILPSTDEVERLIDFQVGKMSKTGSRVSEEVKDRLLELLQMGVNVPSSSHYVRFLDAWKAGDYTSAFDHLHRYFDYTMQTQDRRYYQYALLNLAIIQADFGCYSEALAAMKEAISTARENRDSNCLNYCLSWLYHYTRTHPDELGDFTETGLVVNEKEALHYLKAKAKETEMWSLMSTSLLGEATLTMINGESLVLAMESIIKAAHLNTEYNVTGAFGHQQMVLSSLYGRLGQGYLAWSPLEIFNECYTNGCTPEDTLNYLCRSAYLEQSRGHYSKAVEIMDRVSNDSMRTMKLRQTWEVYSDLLTATHLLHTDNLKACETVLSRLKSYPSPSDEVAFAILLATIKLHLAHEDYSTAMTILDHSCSFSKPPSSIKAVIRRRDSV
jgi:anaphase-promoting complex subunit 5